MHLCQVNKIGQYILDNLDVTLSVTLHSSRDECRLTEMVTPGLPRMQTVKSLMNYHIFKLAFTVCQGFQYITGLG